jgi:hypothetical protein
MIVSIAKAFWPRGPWQHGCAVDCSFKRAVIHYISYMGTCFQIRPAVFLAYCDGDGKARNTHVTIGMLALNSGEQIQERCSLNHFHLGCLHSIRPPRNDDWLGNQRNRQTAFWLCGGFFIYN